MLSSDIHHYKFLHYSDDLDSVSPAYDTHASIILGNSMLIIISLKKLQKFLFMFDIKINSDPFSLR